MTWLTGKQAEINADHRQDQEDSPRRLLFAACSFSYDRNAVRQRARYASSSQLARSLLSHRSSTATWTGSPALLSFRSRQMSQIGYPSSPGYPFPNLQRSTTMKPKHLITMAVLSLLIAVPVGLFFKANAQNSSTPQSQSDYRLSGPYTHKNLTIFLVHGKELMPGKTFLTLQEALAQKKVVVYETKDVNELAIRNLSNQDVYVQAGDVVRGGEQDRMISVDFIVPPRSGRMPISAFCVESGRWSPRTGEAAASFSSSENSVATKDLKLAAKRAGSQEAVWENVRVAQKKLSENVQASVQVSASTSSYELSVETAKV